MGLSRRRRLSEGEHVVVATRTHVKALLGPAVVLIVIAGVAGFLTSLPSGTPRIFLTWVIWLVAGAAIVWFVGRPFLRWLTTTYVVTDRRLITQSGVLAKRGHSIVLSRINDVSYEFGIVDRVLGCGTLVFSVASEGTVELHDIPNVVQVQLTVNDLLHESGLTQSRADDGT